MPLVYIEFWFIYSDCWSTTWIKNSCSLSIVKINNGKNDRGMPPLQALGKTNKEQINTILQWALLCQLLCSSPQQLYLKINELSREIKYMATPFFCEFIFLSLHSTWDWSTKILDPTEGSSVEDSLVAVVYWTCCIQRMQKTSWMSAGRFGTE